MAKIKVKRKKKPQLSKKEIFKFSLSFCIIIMAFLLVLIVFREDIYFLALKSAHGHDIYYAEPTISFWLVLTVILLVIGIIILVCFYEIALQLGMPFKEFFKKSNRTATKYLKRFAVTILIWFVVIGCTFFLSLQYANIADDSGFVKTSLFHSNEIVFTYDSIQRVDVSIEYESLYMINGLLVNPGRYVLVIELTTDTAQYILDEAAFNRDYTNVEKLLAQFNEDIINVDSTNYKPNIARKAQNQKVMDRIFGNK